MRVYLDNNILVDIEDKKLSLDIFRNVDKKYYYFYSYTHIQELMEYTKDFDSLKKMRLKTIFDLTSNAYIFPDNNQLSSKIENPEKIISTLKMFAGHMDITRQTVNNFDIDRDKLISLLGIDTKRINNYTPSEVIDYIDKSIETSRDYLKDQLS